MQRTEGRFIIGILIIAVGVVALLNNFGVIHISIGFLINLLWPLILAAVGINLIIKRQNPFSLVAGAVLIALGVVFFGRNAHLFNVNMDHFWQGFWPFMIILIGLSLLGKSKDNNPSRSGDDDSKPDQQ